MAKLTTIYDNDGGDNPVYIGETRPGTATSTTSKWRIRKRTYSDSKMTGEYWANGNANFDKEWDERASYTYNA